MTYPVGLASTFPTDKLEFWEECIIAALQGGQSVTIAELWATEALLKRNNLIALLGEKPDET